MKTLKCSKISIGFLAGIVLSCPSAATAAATTSLAPPALTLSDNAGNSVTIDGTGAATCFGSCTTAISGAGSPGALAWSGQLGLFTISAVSGQSKPALSAPQVNLALQVTTGSGSGTGSNPVLHASWSDVGFSGTGPTIMAVTSLISGSVNATYTGYIDNTNALFGTGTTVGTIGPVNSSSSTTVTGAGPNGGPFSMSEDVALSMGRSASLALSFNLIAGPQPTGTLGCPAASGEVGVPYDSHLTVRGGTPPYFFSISGNLPAALSLNPSTGEISWSQPAPGTFSFNASAFGSGPGDPAPVHCQIVFPTPTTPPAPLALTCPAVPVEQGIPYSSSLTATGGVPPYSFFIPSGSLPSGLALDPSTGAIFGTPTIAGAFSFTAAVFDSSGTSGAHTATRPCTITIAPPLALSCPASTGQVGVAYSSALGASGGIGADTYSLSSGSLPPGLGLNANSGAITGTPTAAGTFSFTAAVTDSAGLTPAHATASCTTTIAPSIATVTLASSTTPASAPAGASASVTGTGFPAGQITPANVVVTLSTVCGGALVATTTATSVAPVQGTNGQVDFLIPASLAPGTYYVAISDLAPGDANFRSANCAATIVPPNLFILTNGPSGVVLGAPFDFTILVENNGETPLLNVIVKDQLPAEGNFVSSQPSGSLSQGVLTIPLGELPPGASTTVTVTWQAPQQEVTLVDAASASSGSSSAGPSMADVQVLKIKDTLNNVQAVAAGTGLRNRTGNMVNGKIVDGIITIPAIPSFDQVDRAYLVWAVLFQGDLTKVKNSNQITFCASPALNQPCDGTPLNGTNATTLRNANDTNPQSGKLCWPDLQGKYDDATVGFAADVTKIVQGNLKLLQANAPTTYVVANPLNGQNRVGNPNGNDPTPVYPVTDGASLVIFYTIKGQPQTQTMYDLHYDSNSLKTVQRTFTGISVKMTGPDIILVGPDGQTNFTNQTKFTGNPNMQDVLATVMNNLWKGKDPLQYGAFPIGNLWDSLTLTGNNRPKVLRQNTDKQKLVVDLLQTDGNNQNRTDCVGISGVVLVTPQ